MKRIYVQRPDGDYKRVAVLQDGARRATPDQLREIQNRLQAKHGNARIVFVNSASWAHADTILRKNIPGAVIIKDEGHSRRAPNPPAVQTEGAVFAQLHAKAADLLRAARNVPAARGHANVMDGITSARLMWDALEALVNEPAVLRASVGNAAIARALNLATATLERTRQFVADQILGRKRNPRNRQTHAHGPAPGRERVRLRHAVAAGKSIREIGTAGTIMAGSILGGALKVKFDGDRAAHWVASTAVEFLNPGAHDRARLAFVQLLYAAGMDALARDVAAGHSITMVLRIAKRAWKGDPHRAGLIERAEALARTLKVNPARRRRSQPNGHVPTARRRGAGGRFAAGKRAR